MHRVSDSYGRATLVDCSLSFEVVLNSCTHDELKYSDYKPKPYEFVETGRPVMSGDYVLHHIYLNLEGEHMPTYPLFKPAFLTSTT